MDMINVVKKPLDWFKVNPQVRKTFDEESLRQLGASLKVRQLQPVLSQPDGTIIAGERRLRAARLVGLETLEVKIADRQLSDCEIKLWQVQENKLRQDLTGYELWLACTEILSMNADWQSKDLAEHLHVDPSSITRLLSASKTVGPVQDAFKEGKLGVSDVYAISKLPPANQLGLLALKLSGASRDALEEAGRKARSSTKPAEKASRAQLVLTSGIKIVVSGAAICVDSLLEALADAAKELRKAREQNLSVKTLEAVLKSKAKRGAAS
jgi:ParB family transcriptional regulator, chromosome partitioning protein